MVVLGFLLVQVDLLGVNIFLALNHVLANGLAQLSKFGLTLVFNTKQKCLFGHRLVQIFHSSKHCLYDSQTNLSHGARRSRSVRSCDDSPLTALSSTLSGEFMYSKSSTSANTLASLASFFAFSAFSSARCRKPLIVSSRDLTFTFRQIFLY
ncbi:hypothetical protein BpHYR1_031112 [Brachionus plicatilis]|uniref:Uncharacterized protein n=1 Tax=Brachionus plicatilis TaxID=10195 RepID=A0A3M7RS42_BRAPC|nr:hypothetical protein BpHYR1_031112 [Brachionus plicatilis]